jgi:hypothetical protein
VTGSDRWRGAGWRGHGIEHEGYLRSERVVVGSRLQRGDYHQGLCAWNPPNFAGTPPADLISDVREGGGDIPNYVGKGHRGGEGLGLLPGGWSEQRGGSLKASSMAATRRYTCLTMCHVAWLVVCAGCLGWDGQEGGVPLALYVRQKWGARACHSRDICRTLAVHLEHGIHAAGCPSLAVQAPVVRWDGMQMQPCLARCSGKSFSAWWWLVVVVVNSAFRW